MSSPLRGYRIFFALATALGILWVPLWLLRWSGAVPAGGHLQGAAWHGHEMIFGYLAAVLAGFVTLGDKGWRMVGLGLLWLAARGLLLAGPPAVAALGTAADLAFLPLLVLLRRPPLWSGAKLMTLGICAVVAALSAANAWTHWAAWTSGDAGHALLVSADIVTVLLVIVAGRLVPGHTRAYTRRGAGLTLVGAERASIALAVAVVLLDLVGLPLAAGLAGGLLALVQIFRLSRWWDRGILNDPLVWSLHLGFAWIPAGLLLRLASEAFEPALRLHALHALLVGAVGTLTVSIMARLVLGREAGGLVAGPAFALSIASLSVAAAARALPPLLGLHDPAWFWLSGLWWTAALAGAAASCAARIARRPRPDRR